jgi:hypothetical protein
VVVDDWVAAQLAAQSSLSCPPPVRRGTASASTVLNALMLELGRRGQVGEFCECLAATRPLRHELEALRRRLAAP